MEHIIKLFPQLTALQMQQFEQLKPLYSEWNDKINVVSRKDIGSLYTHHVLHSLLLAKCFQFREGAEVLDLGTGGGFPGIPLAIFFPTVQFTLIDGTLKKLKVVQAVADALELKNVVVKHQRAEESNDKFDFVVSRAVAELALLVQWARPLIRTKNHQALPNGLFAYKGGNIEGELAQLNRREYTEVFPLNKFVGGDTYFDEKYVIYVQR